MTTANSTKTNREVQRANHTTIHYTASGPVDGPALVLIHGFACDRNDFDAITDHLPDDFRVLAIDLAEHGESRSTRAAVVVGHLDTRTGTGTAVFIYLSTMKHSDLVQVGRDDGTVATFTVDTVANDPRSALPADLFTTVGRPTLRLITCGRSFDRESQRYSDNTVVSATLTSVQEPLTPVPDPAPVNVPIPQTADHTRTRTPAPKVTATVRPPGYGRDHGRAQGRSPGPGDHVDDRR